MVILDIEGHSIKYANIISSSQTHTNITIQGGPPSNFLNKSFIMINMMKSAKFDTFMTIKFVVDKI